ncbi:MAG: hypothetical protein AAF705_03685 [Bacteroidota bacterium]
MKQIVLSCCFSVLISVVLSGQARLNTTPLGDNLGLQYQLELFISLDENLVNDLQLLKLNPNTGQYTTEVNRLWQRDYQPNEINNYPFVAIETESIDYQLGPNAFLSSQEAQEVWNHAVSPFNPEYLLMGNQVGGFDVFNNMPILIIRPKIGTFINEQLLFNWD